MLGSLAVRAIQCATCTTRSSWLGASFRATRGLTVSTNTDLPDVRNARDLPKEVLVLQATSPSTFAVTALAGHRFAWVKPAGPTGPDQLLVADPLTVQNWFKAEWERGSVTGWPETISKLLGPEAMATTKSAKQHQRLRELFSPMLMDASMSRMLPKIQGSVQRYMRDWAARGTVPAYTETLTLLFDVLVNQAMQLDWPDADIMQYAALFEVWNQGFRPSTNDHMYYRNANCAVVVYDITQSASLDKAKAWVKELQRQANENIIIALAGNKLDLVSEQPDKRAIPTADAEAYAKEAGLLFFETSAKTAENVRELFTAIAKKLPLDQAGPRHARPGQRPGVSLQPESGNTNANGQCSC